MIHDIYMRRNKTSKSVIQIKQKSISSKYKLYNMKPAKHFQQILFVKLGGITRPCLAIRQKLAASENIRVWRKRPWVIRLKSKSNTCILDEYGEY